MVVGENEKEFWYLINNPKNKGLTDRFTERIGSILIDWGVRVDNWDGLFFIKCSSIRDLFYDELYVGKIEDDQLIILGMVDWDLAIYPDGREQMELFTWVYLNGAEPCIPSEVIENVLKFFKRKCGKVIQYNGKRRS